MEPDEIQIKVFILRARIRRQEHKYQKRMVESGNFEEIPSNHDSPY